MPHQRRFRWILERMRPFAFVLLLSASFAGVQAGPLLLRKPALSSTQIVFTYAGDLWSVPRDGGEARRLTTAPGVETSAAFSPDGSTIAFTGGYEGKLDDVGDAHALRAAAG